MFINKYEPMEIVMKKSMFWIIAFTMFTFTFAQDWDVVLEPDFPEILLDMHFLNATHGWLVGEEGTIIATTDGAETFTFQNSGTDKDITKVFFIDEQHGWAGTGNNNLSGDGGSILRTTDGGSTWTEIDISYINQSFGWTYCDVIHFLDQNTGFVIAGKSKSSYLLKTIDGGLTWSVKDSLFATSFYRWHDMDFYGTMNGVVVSNQRHNQRYTTDGGETWLASNQVPDPFFKTLYDVEFIDANTVVAIGEGNEFNGVPTPVYKSTDGGLNWIKKTAFPANSYDRVRSGFWKDAQNGIGVGSNGFSYPFIYKTSDAGETWTPSHANFGFSLRAVSGEGDNIFALGTSSHLIKSSDFGETWEIIQIKTPATLYGLQFTENRGYALSRNGDFLVDADGDGLDWEYRSNTGLWDTGDLFFLNDDIGFVLKENRGISKTTDGGQTWYDVLSPTAFSSRSKVGGITFADENTGYAWVSMNDYPNYFVFKSTDQGETWNEIYDVIGPGYLGGGVGFFDTQTGFLAGPDAWLMKTTDGGTTWQLDTNIVGMDDYYKNKDFESVCVVDENTAWIAGQSLLLKTTNKGETWEFIHHGINDIDSSFYSINFFGDKGYIGSYSGNILKTLDGGNTWELIDDYYDQHIFASSAFNNVGKIFLSTFRGVIIGGDVYVGVDDEEQILPQSYQLHQNYPNPFNPATTIAFDVSRHSVVSITIYDVLGRAVQTLTDKEYQPGRYSVTFNAENLSSGIYYYQMKSETFTQTKKLMFIK